MLSGLVSPSNSGEDQHKLMKHLNGTQDSLQESSAPQPHEAHVCTENPKA